MHPAVIRILRLTLTILFAALTVFIALHPYFQFLATSNYFVYTTFFSIVIIHLRIRPRLNDIVLLLLSTTALVLLAAKMQTYHQLFHLALAIAGLSSLCILAIKTLWAEGAARNLLLWTCVPALLFVLSGWLTPPALHYLEILRPQVLDLYLYSFDCSLGVQPSFWMGTLFLKWPAFHTVSVCCYISLSIVLAVVYAENLARHKDRALSILLAFLFCGPIGEVFYYLYPALGPAHVFLREFPASPLPTHEVVHLLLQPIALPGLRNAIPSLHMSWVLLAWWFSEGTSWICRAIAALFVIFTISSTLGTGEHYLVDLVVAFPFTLFLLALFSLATPWSDPRRWTAALAGLIATLAWFLLLRIGLRLVWISPVLPWTLCTVTVLGAILLRGRLAAAPQPPLALGVPS